MNRRRFFLASALVVGTLVLGFPVSPAVAAETGPQAQPVMALLKAAFGDYRLEDFTFDDKGSEEKGAVFVGHQGKPLPAMSVVRENAEWKLSER